MSQSIQVNMYWSSVQLLVQHGHESCCQISEEENETRGQVRGKYYDERVALGGCTVNSEHM